MILKKIEKAFYLLFPLIVGGLSALISGNFSDTYNLLNKPVLSPPGYVFGIVWSILFILMGLSYYLIKRDNNYVDDNVKFWYYFQLFLNFMWSIIFFRFKFFTFSFIWLLILLLSIWITFLKFKDINKTSAYLLIPYIIWVSFAGYLNLMIVVLN